MDEPIAVEQVPKPEAAAPAAPASPLDDLTGYFRTKAAETPAETPTTPTPETKPEPAAPSIPDAATLAAESARADRLERQLRETEAARAAEKVAAAAAAKNAPPKEEPGEDPRMAEVRENWWKDDAKARELLLEIATDKARKAFAEEWENRAKAEATRAKQDAGVAAARAAVDVVAEKYGVHAKVAEAMIQRAALRIADYVGNGGDDRAWLMPDNYVKACEIEYPVPPAREAAPSPTVPPPPADRADPPGSKQAAPPPKREVRAPSLSPEADRSLSRLTSAVGLSAEGAQRFKATVASNR